MRKLYVRIYLHFVAIIAVFGLVVAFGWLMHDDDDHRRQFDTAARLVARALPHDAATLDAILGQLADDFRIRLALYRDDRTLIASAGMPVPPPPEPGQTSGEWQRDRGGPAFLLRLPDGRWLSAKVLRRPRTGWFGLLAILAIVVAVGAYPLARRVTRRLERLQTRVDALGAGDLGARVDVEGSDEVADLARSFNRAAERIEALVAAQRTMLASASHELRSPLARIRMAIELLAAGPFRPELRERVARDVAELDNLIDELLLASRLETVHDLDAREAVDLLALTGEEGARVGAVVSGSPVSIRGDRRLLRHLVRNLLENARRHGGGSQIDADVSRDGARALLRIRDRGPGIAESERERIFRPFYRPVAMREEGSGVGLGLHLVKAIAELHGASVAYRPNVPAGSCFEVRFPSGDAHRGEAP